MSRIPWLELIVGTLLGVIVAELLMRLEDALRVPPAPDPLDPIVARERWDVWRAAERLTIEGEWTEDATG